MRKSSRWLFRFLLGRIRWGILIRFTAASLILFGVYLVAIKHYNARLEELSRLDVMLSELRQDPGKSPSEWLSVERERNFKQFEYLFYVFLFLIPVSFIVIAIISFIRSSVREGLITAPQGTDRETAERNSELRDTVRTHFARKAKLP